MHTIWGGLPLKSAKARDWFLTVLVTEQHQILLAGQVHEVVDGIVVPERGRLHDELRINGFERHARSVRPLVTRGQLAKQEPAGAYGFDIFPDPVALWSHVMEHAAATDVRARFQPLIDQLEAVCQEHDVPLRRVLGCTIPWKAAHARGPSAELEIIGFAIHQNLTDRETLVFGAPQLMVKGEVDGQVLDHLVLEKEGLALVVPQEE